MTPIECRFKQAVRLTGLLVLPIIIIIAFACSGDPPGDEARDSLSQRQRDSILGESALPGAQGVRGALRAADSAEARQRRLDSLVNEN